MHRCAEEGFARTLSTELPGRLLGDKAYDSDALDGRLEEAWVIEIIAPNRKTQAKTQDGRPLRGAAGRWNVERLFAWLQNFRHIVLPYEFSEENFLAMTQLECIMILFRLIVR